MFRSALDVLDELRERKVALHMLDLNGGDVTGNGISKLVFTIPLGRGRGREGSHPRARGGREGGPAAAQGRYLGGKVPFGFRSGSDGALELVAEEQAIIARARELRQAGEPLRTIRAIVETENGRKLSLDALSHIVRADS